MNRTTHIFAFIIAIACVAAFLAVPTGPAEAQISLLDDLLGGDEDPEDPQDPKNPQDPEDPQEEPGMPGLPGLDGAEGPQNPPGNPQTRSDGNTVWPAGGQPDGPFFDGDPSTNGRIGAATPTAAAIEVSRMRFPANGSAPVVVLARDDDFADALSGSSLTGYGPLLFTNSTAMSPETQAEIDRVLAADGQIWILGGEAAVSGEVAASFAGTDYTVVRLAGPSRIETSLAIADHLWAGPFSPTPRNDEVMVIIARAFPRAGDASGTSAWADAIGMSAPAAARRIPVLLMDGDRGDTRINDWIAANSAGSAEAVIAGGPAAISVEAEEVLTAAFQRYRIGGGTRAATTALAGVWGNGWTAHDPGVDHDARFVVIDGSRADGWAWGLAAAGIAADTNARLVMTAGATVPGETLDTMTSCGAKSVDAVAMGDESVVAASVLDTMETVDGVDCSDPANKAQSMCDAVPVHVMADMLNTAYGINEPWLGGADPTVIETAGAYGCMYRIDYLNASEAGRGFAGGPAKWQVSVFPVGSNTAVPTTAEQEEGCRNIGHEPQTTDGITMCASPGVLDAYIGQSSDGQWNVRVAFDALVLLETAQERFPTEVLLDMAEQVTPYLPSADTLLAQPCYADIRHCRGPQ